MFKWFRNNTKMRLKILFGLVPIFLAQSMFATDNFFLDKQSVFQESTAPFLSAVPKHRGSGNRTFGVGVNYTFPAMGFSAKAALSEKFKVQGNYSRRTYGITGFKYSWTMYGIEGEYCFEESPLNKGAVIPFVFAGLGRGVMDYGDLLGDDMNFGWWSYSVGGALEFFPSFLNNNFGITTRIGYGSMGFGGGSIGEGVSVSGVFMYGFGFHYYLK